MTIAGNIALRSFEVLGKDGIWGFKGYASTAYFFAFLARLRWASFNSATRPDLFTARVSARAPLNLSFWSPGSSPATGRWRPRRQSGPKMPCSRRS